VSEVRRGARDACVCAICGSMIDGDSEDFFSAPPVAFPDLVAAPAGDDISFHMSCYSSWPNREPFARQVLEHWRRESHDNPYWVEISGGTDYLLHANPDSPVVEAALVLAVSGRDIRIKIRDWEKWLATGPSADGLADFEVEALHTVARTLSEKFPTRAHVLEAARSKMSAPQKKSPRPRGGRRLTT